MKIKVIYILVLPCILSLLASGCDKVRALSEQEYVSVNLTLNYEDEGTIDSGKIRYIIRSFPVSAKYGKVDPVQEFTIVKDIQEGYDHEVSLDFLSGDYNVMVWSDLIRDGDETSCHVADNFGEICLLEGAAGNNDYRDAFRGVALVSVPEAAGEETVELEVDMVRPLAKFRLVADDLAEFISSQTEMTGEEVCLEDYRTVISYIGYMPDAYSIYTDRPVDSTLGVVFSSELEQLSETEAYMGFDYVFIGNNETYISVKIAIYDKSGKLVSRTGTVKIPLQRNHDTTVNGKFMTRKVSEGVQVDQEFEGNHVIIIS